MLLVEMAAILTPLPCRAMHFEDQVRVAHVHLLLRCGVQTQRVHTFFFFFNFLMVFIVWCVCVSLSRSLRKPLRQYTAPVYGGGSAIEATLSCLACRVFMVWGQDLARILVFRQFCFVGFRSHDEIVPIRRVGL